MVSVLTPTYNRGNLISKLFESLRNQTFLDIEWIIVDDGSTDNTKEIIQSFIKTEKRFTIRYFYQENQGKHIALNKLYELANGEYTIIVDDDDELFPSTIERGVKIWNYLPNKDEYWSVCGRCIDANSRKIIGKLFTENMNNFSMKKQNKILSNIKGDLFSFQKASIVKQYKFPNIQNSKYVPEDIVWKEINLKYKQYFTNEQFLIYHRNQINSLSSLKCTSKTFDSAFYIDAYKLNRKFLRPRNLRYYFILIVQIQTAIYLNKKLKPELKNVVKNRFDLFMIRATKPFGLLISKKKGWINK